MNADSPNLKPDFEAVPEDWSKAIAVVAHPDDLEYGASSAVARWTSQGKEVIYVMVTSGEAGIQTMDPETTRKNREAEQIEAARIVGVSVVDFMRLPDGQLEANLNLRRALAQVIRKHQPEIIISTNFRESFSKEGGSWNHSDHRALGPALIDAVRDAANKWAFSGQLPSEQLSSECWDGVSFAIFSASPLGRHYVDVSKFFQLGVDSLLAHKAYLDALHNKASSEASSPHIFLESMARDLGKQVGVEMAQSFELINL